MARGFDDIKPSSGNRDSLKIEEIVDIHKFEDGQYESIRLLPTPMLPVKTHWIKILAGKQGEQKREVKVPRLCVSFDPDNEAVAKEGTDCPYCKLPSGQDAPVQTSVHYYANAIIRDEQENEPRKKMRPTAKEKKTGLKEKGSKAWTPVKVIKLPSGLARKLQQLKQRNKNVSIADAKGGCDVAIMYDSKASASNAYTIDRGDKSPLTPEEKKYLVWDLSDDVYELLGLMSQEQADEDFKRMDVVGADQIDDDDDDDDDIALNSRRRKSSKKTSTKRRRTSSMADDDDEDEAPRKKRRSSSTKRRRSSEDEAPRKKRRRSSSDDDKPVRKKRPASKSGSATKKRRSKANF